jgi:hypothetical protein
MKSVRLHAWVVACVLFFGITNTLALMPPHIQSTIPPHEGILGGDTFLFHGYSLEYAEAGSLKVILVKTGEAVEHTTKTSCTLEGQCDEPSPPGSCQEKCEMRVFLKHILPGEQYEIHFLEWKSRFTTTKAKPNEKKEEKQGK